MTANNIIEKHLQNAKIPPLVLDQVWQNQFPKAEKTHEMLELEACMLEQIKKQARLFEVCQIKRYVKQKHLKEILALSQHISTNITTESIQKNQHIAKKMKQLKRKIEKINQELAFLEDKLLAMPEQMQKTNHKLLACALLASYQNLKKQEAKINVLDRELATLQQAVALLERERFVTAKKKNAAYHLVHNLAGVELMNLLDASEHDTNPD